MVTDSLVSKVAASIGRAAFLAPEIEISPSNGWPPRMSNLSTEHNYQAVIQRETALSFPIPRVYRSGLIRREYPCPFSRQGLYKQSDVA